MVSGKLLMKSTPFVTVQYFLNTSKNSCECGKFRLFTMTWVLPFFIFSKEFFEKTFICALNWNEKNNSEKMVQKRNLIFIKSDKIKAKSLFINLVKIIEQLKLF